MIEGAVKAPSSGQYAMSSAKQVRQVGHSFIRWFYYDASSSGPRRSLRILAAELQASKRRSIYTTKDVRSPANFDHRLVLFVVSGAKGNRVRFYNHAPVFFFFPFGRRL